jgi:hypothetical protein
LQTTYTEHSELGEGLAVAENALRRSSSGSLGGAGGGSSGLVSSMRGGIEIYRLGSSQLFFVVMEGGSLAMSPGANPIEL